MAKNVYWSVYKRIEKELIETTHFVKFDDAQIKMYSDILSDILIRTSVEIESISKELYLNNGGTPVEDPSQMYFDNVCLKFLNDKWNIAEKEYS